jgi:hypothetical protein
MISRQEYHYRFAILLSGRTLCGSPVSQVMKGKHAFAQSAKGV